MTKQRFALVCMFLALCLAAGSVLVSRPAQADGPKPGTSVSLSAPAFTADFYERTVNQAGQGSPSETGPIVVLPQNVGSGYVVIMDCGNPIDPVDRNNVSNWSDVLHFIDSGEGTGRTAQLLSTGATFPSAVTVLASPNAFISEMPGAGNDDLDVTVFTSGGQVPNIYNVHSAARLTPCAPAQVPEGDTLVLVGTGLAGLAGYAGLRWRARRHATSSRTRGGAEG